MEKFIRIAAMIALVLLISLATASATPTPPTLQYLVENDLSMQVGDKMFYDFEFNNICSGVDPFCLPLDASGILVVPQDIDPLHHGIRFNGSFQAYGPASTGNFTIGYKVQVLPPSTNSASDMHLALSGVVLDCEVGAICNILIGETLRNDQNQVIAQLQVTNSVLDDHAFFDPLKSFSVIKDISLNAYSTQRGDAHVVKFSVLDQIVSQTPGEVPEPGTYALMGVGLIGLAFLKRRKT